MDPIPTPEQLAKAYGDDFAKSGWYFNDYNDALQTNRPFYDLIVRILRTVKHPVGPVVDYGCGFGGLCSALHAAGIDYVGFDLSRDEIALAQKNGLKVAVGGIEDIPEDLKPAGIIMVFVFEHLSDYESFMERCRSLLPPGGIMIIVIPTSPFVVFSWKIMRALGFKGDLPKFNEAITPWHTVIFSAGGIRSLMLRHGFQVVSVLRSPKSKAKGWLGLVKVVLEIVEKIGFGIFSERFPFMTSQTFVCRKQ